MPAGETETSTRGTAARRQNGHATGARNPATPDRTAGGAPRGAPRAEETWNGARPRQGSGCASSEKPEAALRGLLRGLHAGDLESVLLTVAMAAEENRMPSADPDEERRILAFLARLAEHDAALPPPDASGAGAEWPVDGGAGTGARDPG